jgi:hypothetical protein
MIEYFVRSLFAHELASFVGARRAEHAQTTSARQLHSRSPHTAAGAVHQSYFAWPRVGALDQPAICRRVRRAHGRALCERNVFRQGMYLRRFTQGKLGIRTAGQ